MGYDSLKELDPNRPDLPDDVREQVEVEIKYEGYIKRQQAQIKEMRRLERMKIPENTDYTKMSGLRLEAIEKLCKVRPENIGQAGRISGVTPADVSVLIIQLEKARGKE